MGAPHAFAQSATAFKEIVLNYLRQAQGEGKQYREEDLPPEVAISGGAGTFFNDPSRLGVIELSPYSHVRHPTIGPVLMGCLKANGFGPKPAYYTVFIFGRHIADVRQSIIADKCEQQTYQALGRFRTIKRPSAEKR